MLTMMLREGQEVLEPGAAPPLPGPQSLSAWEAHGHSAVVSNGMLPGIDCLTRLQSQADIRRELMDRLLSDAAQKAIQGALVGVDNAAPTAPSKASTQNQALTVDDQRIRALNAGFSASNAMLVDDHVSGTVIGKRPRYDSMGNVVEPMLKRLRLSENSTLDAKTAMDVLEEELAETKAHLEELRSRETSLFMQLTAATLPSSPPTRSPSPQALDALWKGEVIRSPRQKAMKALQEQERQLCLERAARLAAEQTLADVRREIQSPHVAYMLMGALECMT